jgi:bifunctional DNA-binding transcriptional regulator/antitoxin component of YhaV-PrlF toxin-antitoxin module
MITKVTGKHQVTIPAKLASAMGIASGTRLEWAPADSPGEIRVRVLPSRRAVANTLLGAGRKLAYQAAATP